MSAQDPGLKSHLWNCAEILRGSAVDRTDWKAYILPLLFFKRISDVWDEETAEAAELFGDVDPVDFARTRSRSTRGDGSSRRTSARRRLRSRPRPEAPRSLGSSSPAGASMSSGSRSSAAPAAVQPASGRSAYQSSYSA